MEGDRRQRHRYPCIGIVEVKVKRDNRPSQILSAMMNNISEMGMKCNATESLEKGTSVSLRIMEFMGDNINEKIEGTVTWLAGSGKSYYIGILFDKKLNPDDHPNLCRLICDDM